jgi:hypothetical protein
MDAQRVNGIILKVMGPEVISLVDGFLLMIRGGPKSLLNTDGDYNLKAIG